MQDYFYTLADMINQELQGDEIYLCEFSGEKSDFVRFNQAKIRQSGSVEQRYIELDLIRGKRHLKGKLALSGDKDHDREQIRILLNKLRTSLSYLPEDPYLLYATQINSTQSIAQNSLPIAQDAVTEILTIIQGQDFVGFYATGGIFKGFANSLGQRNWHSRYNFNVDWCLYHAKDKAVKSAYAGFNWDIAQFKQKIAEGISQLQVLKRPAHTISPGCYPVYLAPAALYEILQLLTWNGFSLKAQRSKESPLLRMVENPSQHLHNCVTLLENTADGIAPAFQAEGFIKPSQVTLIRDGLYESALASPRSAQEYGVTTNGANCQEIPNSMDLMAGAFSQIDVLKTLNTGVYINNLWYLNYSDRSACRMTGMTRFATFWVEQGEIVAPLNVMRFDETLYRLLGDKLLALTAEREFIIDTNTYEKRSVDSGRVPGALVDEFTFTL